MECLKKQGLWMPKYQNDELIGCLLRKIVEVISRRTSENYAAMVLSNITKKLNEKHDFLSDVEIKNPQLAELDDIVNIKSDLSYVELEEVGQFVKDLVNELTELLGKLSGYYLIREIKNELPYDYGLVYAEQGVDLGIMQLEHITQRIKNYGKDLKNSQVLAYIFKAVFEILDDEVDREYAITTLNELINRFNTKYDILKYVKINDIRSENNLEIVTVNLEVDSVNSDDVGSAVQKIFQEANNYLNEKGNYNFVEKLSTYIKSEYAIKFNELGINIKTIRMKQDNIIKQVFESLIEILSEMSSKKEAIIIVDAALKKLSVKYDSLNYITIETTENSDIINISPDIDKVSSYEIGRGIQKLLENVIGSIGGNAGKDFLTHFKNKIGKAYLLRMEEMGVNLYLLELRQNAMW